MAEVATVPVQFRVDIDLIEDFAPKAIQVAKFFVAMTPTPNDDRIVAAIENAVADPRLWAFLRFLAGQFEPEMVARNLQSQRDEEFVYAASALGVTQAGFIEYLPIIIQVVRLILQFAR